jgi:FkbM family methyltransferase
MNHTLWPPNGHLAQFILDQFPEGYIGWGVDVGASDGISINTTYQLEAAHRWTILSVEANPEFGPMLKRHRAFVHMCACAHESGSAIFHVNELNPEAFSALTPTLREDLYPTEGVRFKKIPVPVCTVDSLLALWQFPQLDLLCVDTEGTELSVLKGCDLEKWKPKVLVIECWDKVGPIDLYLESFGYKKIGRNCHNDVWLLKEES